MSRIFISYRRGDTSPYAGRLHDKLSLRFGPSNVFRDIDDIAPGADFVKVIEQSIGQCDAALVLIGADWSTITNDKGIRRLDDPRDFIRLEVGTALAKGIPVIPLLVEEAEMPSAEELPKELAPLSTRNGVELTDERFDYDFEKLATALEGYLGKSPEGSTARYPRRKVVQAAAVALAVALLTGAFLFFRGDEPVGPAKTGPPVDGLSAEAAALLAAKPSSCIDSPDTPATESVAITSPLPGEKVVSTPTVKGTANLESGQYLYFFSYAPGICYYYFDPYEAVQVSDEGSWENRVDVTASKGEKMMMVATVVGPDTRGLFEELLDYFRSNDPDNSHVRRLPPGTRMAHVTVQVAD
jgi:hypothetical protein